MSQNTSAASLPNFSQFAKKLKHFLGKNICQKVFLKEKCRSVYLPMAMLFFQSGKLSTFQWRVQWTQTQRQNETVMFWKILLLKHVDPDDGTIGPIRSTEVLNIDLSIAFYRWPKSSQILASTPKVYLTF